MPSKIEHFRQLSERTAREIASSPERWTAFLTTAGRLYKYPFHEQLLIFAQRPEATACADYELWNHRMGRYVRRGGRGIALLDDTSDRLRLRYVFDVADTGTTPHSRTPWLWQLGEQHKESVTAMLEATYGAAGDNLPQILSGVAQNLTDQYWEDGNFDYIRALDNSPEVEYDEFTIGIYFKAAASVSVAYSLLSRCGLHPEEHFKADDFKAMAFFQTPVAIAELGKGIGSISEGVLRQIEAVIRKYERERLTERMENNGRTELHSKRRTLDSRPEAEQPGPAAPEQVRQNAESLSEGTPFGILQPPGSHRGTVSPLPGGSGDIRTADGAAASPAGEGSRSNGAAEGQRPDEMGGPDEQLQGTGRGDSDSGAYQQLTINLFPTEQEQIESIEAEAEDAQTSSAFSFPLNEIDHVLRLGGNTDRNRERIVAMFQEQHSLQEIAQHLKLLYHGGNGIGGLTVWYAQDGIRLSRKPSARYDKAAQIFTWEAAAERIGQLLNTGEFATELELEEAEEYERFRLAEKLWVLYYDFSDEAREAGYLPSLANNPERGFPAESAWLTEQLKSPVFLKSITEEYTAFRAAYQQDRNLMRFHYHKHREIWESLQNLSLPRITFSSQLSEAPVVRQFITEDEIDADIARGNGFEGGKGRIFTYFQESHTDKEKVDFLRHEYGIGGHSHALSNARGSDESHDGKGLHYKKDGCPDVHFTWEKVSNRITDLIRKGRYLTEQEQAAYDKVQTEKALAEAEEMKSVGDNPLETAKRLIDEFCRDEYDSPPDFSDLSHIGIAYTTTEDSDIPIEVFANLLDFSIERHLNGVLFGVQKFDTLEQMITDALQFLDFDELVAVTDEEVKQAASEKESAEEMYREKSELEAEVEAWEKQQAAEKQAVLNTLSEQELTIVRAMETAGFIFTPQSANPGLHENLVFTAGDYGYPITFENWEQAYKWIDSAILRDTPGLREQVQQILHPETQNSVHTNEEHPVSIQVNGEWQTFPNTKAAEEAAYEEYKNNLRRNAENFHITDEHLGEGGPKAKFQANIEAIKLLKYLEKTTEQATPEQQVILSRYVGWGGLADAFDPEKPSWSAEYAQLKELLTPEEYTAARASTLNAHYTSPTIIRAIYEAVGNMGFETGNILDKTTPRLIQFHTFKNAVNPPFLGGFSIFSTVAAWAERHPCQ